MFYTRCYVALIIMKYTKYGENRYIFLILDEHENVVSKIDENISNKNVIDKMHKLGIADCNRHYGDSYDGHLMRVWASNRKEDLNKDGYGLFNSSGYLAHFNDNRNNIKVKYVVIDITQKEKHPLNVSRFYNAT